MDADLRQPVHSVLMTADTVGGVWTYCMTLARALRQHDVSVFLATMGAPVSEDQRRQADALENVTVFESTYRLEWMEEPWEDVQRAGDWLLELEQRIEPDLVHLNGYSHGALEWEHPTLVVGHSCVLSWWKAVKGGEAPESWDRYRREVRRGLAAADSVVAPSRAMAAELRRYYGRLLDVKVIPNASELQAETPALRRREPVVFAAGRLWDEAKNVAALDAVAGDLEWPVLLAGDGYSPRGARLLGRLNAAQMQEHYARAAIYALPARYEPFGLSVLEAALSGCALVLGDIPSLRENWDGAAIFVTPDDHDALRLALRNLIADDETRLEMAARSQARALNFTPERMAEQYLELYRTCAQNCSTTR